MENKQVKGKRHFLILRHKNIILLVNIDFVIIQQFKTIIYRKLLIILVLNKPITLY